MNHFEGPDGTFALAGRRVIRFGLVFVVLVATLNAGYLVVPTGDISPTGLNTVAWIAAVTAFLGLAGGVCAFGLFISAIVWIVSAHRVTPAGPGVIGYAGVVLWSTLVVSAYIVPPGLPTVSTAVLADAGLRIAGTLLLVGAVLLVRTRVRQETGRHTVDAPAPPVASEDWGGGWDPEVQREIERRRLSGPERS